MGVKTASAADIYTDVTNRIIAALESGTAPWVRPWRHNTPNLPHNASTLKPYSGANVLLLWAEEQAHGYTSPGWVTFKQARALGGAVRKGEKGTPIVFWYVAQPDKARKGDKKPAAVRKGKKKAADDDKPVRMWARYYTVFNVDQCDNLNLPKQPTHTFCGFEQCDRIIADTGAQIKHGGAKAAYSPTHDRIRMPTPASFDTSASYYATLLHELCHWTGAQSRLARDLSCTYGSESYAIEELTAELGSAFLCARIGIPGQLNHADYIGAWVKALRTSPRVIFQVASRAQAAADYIMQ